MFFFSLFYIRLDNYCIYACEFAIRQDNTNLLKGFHVSIIPQCGIILT